MILNEEIQDAFNELRLIVLLECDDNKFRQVMLTPAKFKRVSDIVAAHKPKEQPGDLRPGHEITCVHINSDWEMPSDAFLGLASDYEDADQCDSDSSV